MRCELSCKIKAPIDRSRLHFTTVHRWVDSFTNSFGSTGATAAAAATLPQQHLPQQHLPRIPPQPQPPKQIPNPNRKFAIPQHPSLAFHPLSKTADTLTSALHLNPPVWKVPVSSCQFSHHYPLQSGVKRCPLLLARRPPLARTPARPPVGVSKLEPLVCYVLTLQPDARS